MLLFLSEKSTELCSRGCGLIIHVETLFPDLKVKEKCEGEFTFFMFFLSEKLVKKTTIVLKESVFTYKRLLN